jgi:C4-dicarboxylate transporter DctM subunit
MILIAILLALLTLIGLAMPIAFALALVSIVVLAFSGVDMLVLVQQLYRGTESFPLLAACRTNAQQA